ncbi:MAG TPA: nitroreductase family deazaflavin-dependent oxidoreductase [Agromyces mariniharenae]|nr:nitroreductase family deazaflavin-dependent oxidoreductase [Agromyces mariniharenae]
MAERRGITAWMVTTRWIVRAPIPLFRAGFGFVFGGRLMMLEHRGRVSGKRRYTVLEVAEHESPTSIVVPSGFGPHAQWLQNLQAEPRCGVSVGWRTRVSARATVLDAAESRVKLARYAAQHPVLWPRLERLMAEVTGEDPPVIPLVRLEFAEPVRVTRRAVSMISAPRVSSA